MIRNKKVLAVIPARAGSKRLPKKNIQNFLGFPLIVYTIKAAKACKYIDKIIVSSDSDEIIKIALDNNCKAEKRKPHLSSDEASTIDVLKDIIDRNIEFDIIVTLQPTSPLRTSNDIINALELYVEKDANAVISVCKADYPPNWLNTLGNEGEMDKFVNIGFKKKLLNNLEDYYRLNGAVYCNNLKLVMTRDTLLFDEKIYAYKMPRNSSVDIDTIEDFEFAEYLMSKSINVI